MTLRTLKQIEVSLRLDFPQTLAALPPELGEYLALVREVRSYHKELKKQTALSSPRKAALWGSVWQAFSESSHVYVFHKPDTAFACAPPRRSVYLLLRSA